jgi:hypothetical protein
MESEIAALTRAVRAHLTATAEIWGGRVYVDFAPAQTTYPYITYTVTDRHALHAGARRLSALLFRVTCAAASAASLFTCAERIADRLDDADYATANALDSGYDWAILTLSREGMTQRAVLIDGSPVYELITTYRVVMQAR